MQAKNKIKKLPEEVINRIAAGEVVQKPVNGYLSLINSFIQVVKELIENCIDANSNEISINCKQSGLEELTIVDNGSGIDVSDFPLLCERFATSKLENFGQLSTINSFGFRGEALASISFVGYLQITSKIEQNNIGYCADFHDGKLVGEPQLISCQRGTQVKVKKLFYNLDARRQSINKSEQISQILELVKSISLHHFNIKFKLVDDNKILFSTNSLLQKVEQEKQLEIATVLMDKPKEDLLFFENSIKIQGMEVQYKAIFTKVGAVKKHRQTIIFINNRLIDNDNIRHSLENCYKSCWVAIHEDEGGYIAYISLIMDKNKIDINVHPTKKIIKFIYQEEICEQLLNQISEQLKQSCSIRVYHGVQYTQSQLVPKQALENQATQQQQSKKIYDKNLVRSDPKAQKIDGFLSQANTQQQPQKQQNFLQKSQSTINQNSKYTIKIYEPQNNKPTALQVEPSQQRFEHAIKQKRNGNKQPIQIQNNFLKIAPLLGVQILIIFLFKMNKPYEQLMQFPYGYFIFQQIFCQYCVYNLKQLLAHEINDSQYSIHNFCQLVLSKQIYENEDRIKIQQKTLLLLEQHSDILSELFNIKFSKEGQLLQFPKIFSLPLSSISDLSEFCLRILHETDFATQEACFLNLCQELAILYSESLFSTNFDLNRDKFNAFFQNELFPYLKKNVSLSKINLNEIGQQILALEDIYKIFERC